MKFLLLLAALPALFAQGTFGPLPASRIVQGASLPATCSVGMIYFLNAGSVGTYQCISTNTWVIFAAGGAGTGTVTSVGLVGTANQITVTGTSPITNTGSFTLSFPAGGVTLPGTTTGTFTGNLTGNASGSAATLATTRAIYGNNFDGSTALTQIIASTFGGTGNGFTKFSGPATAERTFTLPNASSVILTDNAAVTVAQGGTGRQTLTNHGILLGAGTTAITQMSVGATDAVLMGTSAADPSFVAVANCGDSSHALAYSTTTHAFSCQLISAGTGTVTTTGSPVSGNLAAFSGTTSVTSGDLSGDISTSGTLVTAIGASKVTNTMLAGSIDLTTKVTGILPGANGGSGNGFFAVTGLTTSLKTFTFPNASATVLTSNAAVTVAQGGTGVATITGLIKGAGTSAFAAAAAADVFGLWSGTCSSSTFLRGDGACAAPGGSGTVTVVGAGSLTSTALVTGGGSQALQTAAATATMDSSGNISTPGTISAGSGASNAGNFAMTQGTANVAGTNQVGIQAPTSVTSAFNFTLPGAPAAGVLHATNATPSVLSASAVDLTADVTGILPTANGGTANAFFTVSGPATSAKTFTFPNASSTVLTSNAAVTVAQGGTGAATLTGILLGNGTSAVTTVTAPSGTIVGTTDTQTLSAKTLTSPKVTTITDGNGNPFLISSATASAVDSMTITNAATANPATVIAGATGSDANVNLRVAAKGTGVVQLGSTNATVDGSGNLTVAGCTGCGAGGGGVTSVGQSFTGGLISVGGSPVTTSGTLALTVAGTSGGVPYFSSASTWASSAALPQGGIMYGGGAGNPPVATSAGTAKQVVLSGGTGAPTMIDFPDVKIIPAANCNNATAGSGWDLPATNAPTAACRAGTNNLDGVLSWANNNTTTNAQFSVELPNDWDTATQPYINIFYGSGANTSGTVKWTASTACTKADGSVTDDPAFNAESASTGKTMAAASRMWSETLQFTAVTSGNNCIAGSNMAIKLTSGNGTAASAVTVSKIVLTIPRLLTVQAN